MFSFSKNEDSYEIPPLKEADFQEIVQIGRDLCARYPRSRFFAIGQSPSWIVESMALDAARENRSLQTGLIPFSSGFLKLPSGSLSEEEDALVLRFEHKDPMADNLRPWESWDYKNICGSSYRDVLRRRGADPQSIVESYRQNGLKTTLIDFFNTGVGTASFLFTLFSLARQSGLFPEMKEALNVHVLLGEHGNFHAGQMLKVKKLRCLKLYPFGTESCEVGFSKVNNALRTELWMGTGDERLVEYYPLATWEKEPYPCAPGHEKVVLSMYERLRKALSPLHSTPACE